MDFRLLGPVEIVLDGSRAELSGAKIHTVLAALVLARGRVVPDERLSRLLWGWDPPATMSAQIYTYVSRLRKHLTPGTRIERRAPGYVLETGDGRVDILEYEQLDRLGRHALQARQFEKAAALLHSALELWHGNPLSNVTEFLAESERPTWEEARAATLENRIEADLAVGRHGEIVSELTQLVAEHPLRERLRAQLMTALYRSDRQADALAVHRDGRDLLRDELGVDPGPVLTEVYQALLTGTLATPEGVTVSGTPQWAGVVPAMLPADLPDFSGRREPLAEVMYELSPVEGGSLPGLRRRVVVTGMPGVGKSALATRAAHLLRPDFPDGQLHADLGASRGRPRAPFQVLAGFLAALGVAEDQLPGSLDERVQLYRSRTSALRLLVVLDNAADGAQAHQLLPGGERSRTLLTSRGPLPEVEGVRLIRLAPFSLQEGRELLVRALGEARVAADPRGVADLCELGDRLPLALRICAARLADRPDLPPGRLAARLARVQDRLDGLRYGGLDIRACLRPSFRRLPPRALDVLHGLVRMEETTFTAAQVADRLPLDERRAEEALELLSEHRLLDISGLRGHRVSYSLLPLVRLFAQEEQAASGRPAVTVNGN